MKTEAYQALQDKKDLAVALINGGATYAEVAEMFKLPRDLIKGWVRGRVTLTPDARQRARMGR